MGHMTVFLSACPSDCLWAGTLTSLCDDVLRRITSRRERERIVPWRKPVSEWENLRKCQAENATAETGRTKLSETNKAQPECFRAGWAA